MKILTHNHVVSPEIHTSFDDRAIHELAQYGFAGFDGVFDTDLLAGIKQHHQNSLVAAILDEKPIMSEGYGNLTAIPNEENVPITDALELVASTFHDAVGQLYGVDTQGSVYGITPNSFLHQYDAGDSIDLAHYDLQDICAGTIVVQASEEPVLFYVWLPHEQPIPDETQLYGETIARPLQVYVDKTPPDVIYEFEQGDVMVIRGYWPWADSMQHPGSALHTPMRIPGNDAERFALTHTINFDYDYTLGVSTPISA